MPGEPPAAASNTSMFVNATLARRIERAEAGLILDGSRAAARRVPAEQLLVRELHGGVAAYVEAGAPFNKVAGVGFDGPLAPETLDGLEREFASRGEPLRFEVSTLADPGIARTLTRRGYGLMGFENVLGLRLGPELSFAPVAGVDVTRAREEENAVWLDVVATAFMSPDVFDGPPSVDTFPRELLDRVFGDTIAARGFERYLARRNGVVAGGASFRMQDAVAQLNGAATLPDHRRHGVQSALLRHRLAEAIRRGCDIAVVTTEPGSRSQENVQRIGFSLLYARAVLVKEAS